MNNVQSGSMIHKLSRRMTQTKRGVAGAAAAATAEAAAAAATKGSTRKRR